MSRETFQNLSLTLTIPMYNPQVESTAIVRKKIKKNTQMNLLPEDELR